MCPGYASLPRSGTGGRKALDQLRGIKTHFQGLFDIFYGRIFIKTDKGLAALNRGLDQFTAPGRCGQVLQPCLDLLDVGFHVATAINRGHEACQTARGFNGQRVIQAQHTTGGMYFGRQFCGQKEPGVMVIGKAGCARDSGPVRGVIPAEATRRSQANSLWSVPWIVLSVTLVEGFLAMGLAGHPSP